MKSKRIICGLVAATVTLSVAFSGCSLVSTLNEEDMKQVVATVDIRKSGNLESEGLSEYASAVSSTSITKRELVSYFISYGSSYVSGGMSYADTFDMCVNSLAQTAVVTQYATLYMLKDMATNSENPLNDPDAVEKFTQENLTLAERYEYLLGGEDSDDVKLAKYQLYSTINNSLDSIEESIIDGEDEESGTDSRTTPGNVDTEVEDYYPADANGNLDYYVYTGFDGYELVNSGKYQDDALDGTSKRTRVRAYNRFISSLRGYYLLSSDEIASDVLSLSYIQDEYVSILRQLVVNNYYELYEEQQEKLLTENDYAFVQQEYNKLLQDQTRSYSTLSGFESDYGSLSDTSFILYSPSTESLTEEKDGGYGTYGYVYNILLPFDTVQSTKLSELSTQLSNDLIVDDDYYIARRALLSSVKTTDQRSAWFNGTTDYSFDATEANWTGASVTADDMTTSFYNGGDENRKYLFFENNLIHTDRYEALTNYIGKYSYNGTVRANEDGTYTLIANKLSIDDMLSEFTKYVNYVLGYSAVSSDDDVTDAYNNVTTYYKENSDDEIDYSKFVYASGKVDLTDSNAESAFKETMFVTTTARYKAMAAVNELQYAYTTDTSVLSQYIGYTVGADTTSYIKEFEYAAQTAVKRGAGSYVVCAGDYGWHLIYVTDTFSAAGGEVYSPSFTEDNITTEGSFEYKFYEWLKDTYLTNVSTKRQSIIIQNFGGDSTVKIYTDRFEDLRGLDS